MKNGVIIIGVSKELAYGPEALYKSLTLVVPSGVKISHQLERMDWMDDASVYYRLEHPAWKHEGEVHGKLRIVDTIFSRTYMIEIV